MREFKDVHDGHCCKVHGCKYCDDNCTVESGECEGIFCEDCQYEEDVRAHNPIKITNTNQVNLNFSWKWANLGLGDTSIAHDPMNGFTVKGNNLNKEKLRQILHALADTITDEAKICS